MTVKHRVKKLIGWGSVLLLVGLAYAGLCRATGWALPCLFYKITGCYCPGCGVTRMCLAMLRLDFAAAFSANKGVFTVLPILGWLAARMVYFWVKGEGNLSKAERILTWILLGYFLLFAVLRNLPGFSYLAPMG